MRNNTRRERICNDFTALFKLTCAEITVSWWGPREREPVRQKNRKLSAEKVRNTPAAMIDLLPQVRNGTSTTHLKLPLLVDIFLLRPDPPNLCCKLRSNNYACKTNQIITLPSSIPRRTPLPEAEMYPSDVATTWLSIVHSRTHGVSLNELNGNWIDKQPIKRTRQATI
jgi:hypothetical protein